MQSSPFWNPGKDGSSNSKSRSPVFVITSTYAQVLLNFLLGMEKSEKRREILLMYAQLLLYFSFMPTHLFLYYRWRKAWWYKHTVNDINWWLHKNGRGLSDITHWFLKTCFNLLRPEHLSSVNFSFLLAFCFFSVTRNEYKN